MEKHQEILNGFLVEVFDQILKTEEERLSVDGFLDLSLKEMHLIEAVVAANNIQGADNRSAAIAAKLRITAGSLTTAAALLEKKGYITRNKDEKDKRVVRLKPTASGMNAHAHHEVFHREMVEDVLSVLTPEEATTFVRALSSVAGFFRSKES